MKKTQWDATGYLLLLWWLIHFIRALYMAPDTRNAGVTEGDLFNQVEFLSLFVISLFHFEDARKHLGGGRGFWAKCLLAYVLWSIVTINWSVDSALTLRRLGLFFVGLVSWIGIGAGYYGGEEGPLKFSRDLRYGCLILVALSLPIILPELTPSNLLNPYWESAIRDTSTDLVEALLFGVLACYVPAVLRGKAYVWKPRLLMMPAASIFFLLLIIKARSAIAMTLLVLAFLWTGSVSRRGLRNGLRVALTFLLVFIVANFSTDALQETAIGQFLARGNNMHTLESLNGRTELWNYILSEIQIRPLQGYGFGAFWTAERMDTVWSRFHWHAPVAHNGYLDELVQNGSIGLGLMLAFLFSTIARLRKLGNQYPAAKIAISWICLFLLLNLTDSHFQNFRRFSVILTMFVIFSCLGASPLKSKKKRAGFVSAEIVVPEALRQPNYSR